MSHDVSRSVSTDVNADVTVENKVSKKIPFEVVSSDRRLNIDPFSGEEKEIAATAKADDCDSAIPTNVVVPAEVVSAAVPAAEVVAVDPATDEATDLVESKKTTKKKIKPKKVKLVESIEDEAIEEPSEFEALNLIPAVVTAIENSGYKTPTPIQAETIPFVLSGADIIGSAETGSGKTAAFACPLLSQLDMSINAPQVLVLAPTRELAIQVTVAFQKYGAHIPGFRAVTIYGGQSYETQHNAIRRGVQVVVGTPGRVMDHLRQGTLDLSNLKTFVLDEGDEMLRMGFIDDVEWILEQLPTKRQILLFSATMPAPIQRIAQTYLKKPITISIKSDTATADSIEQSCVLTQPRAKIDVLAQILESEETDGVIVFVKTRNTTVMVADALTQRGFSATPLNGEIPQNQRERTISHLKSGRLNVLVATDVAARGLDVQRISHVINYDFPHDTEAYIHRIGRTGRAGRVGAAILFVEPKEQGKLKRLQRETNQQISTFKQKSLAEINNQRVERFKLQITEKLADESQLNPFAKIVQEYQQETGTPMEKIAAAMGLIAQGETPLMMTEVVNNRSNWKTDRDNKGGRRFEGEMTTYRIEVGRNHGVAPGNIVGAITNEANLDNSSIGKIKLFDDFSTIDLPSSLPSHVIDTLQGVVVMGQSLRISPDRSPSSRYSKSPRKRNDGSTKFVKRKSSDGKPGRDHSTFNRTASEGAATTSERTSKKPFDRARKSSGAPSPFRKTSDRVRGPKSSLADRSAPRSDENRESTSKKPGSGSRQTPMRKFVKIRSSK